ncbi:MAG TPA: LysM peptidoglycan-binding domain-containing protein [Candidatus Baltobacteraceae bacterium]|jgi:nucleoid-associated protein YgaU|nr:LysM peptidoglycan-binding domain-containing protein [Candidatus Baltobacteraceae bacterium]
MPKPLKATFQIVNPDGSLGSPLSVNFNPTEYTLNKGAQIAEIAIPGLDSPILQFVRGQTETLSVDLFFDSTESGMDDSAVSVTTLTDQFYQLVKINGTTHAPPICFFSWGAEFPGQRIYSTTGCQQRHGFQCLVESVRQRFTLFSPQGVPLRATLTVSMKEYKTLAEQIAQLNMQSPDVTHSHVVQIGETLSDISASVYNDPTQWRAIATQNSLANPLVLVPGTILVIPPLTS